MPDRDEPCHGETLASNLLSSSIAYGCIPDRDEPCHGETRIRIIAMSSGISDIITIGCIIGLLSKIESWVIWIYFSCAMTELRHALWVLFIILMAIFKFL